MEAYDVKITPYALEQMTEIRDYIAHDLMNPQAAGKLIREIRTEVLKLSQMPQRFKPIEEEPWGERGVRKFIVNNFYVYYMVKENTAAVYVTAVTYAKRNQINVLNEMETE